MHPEASRTHPTTRATILPVRTSPRSRVHASALPLLGTMVATLAVAIIVIVLAASNLATLPDMATVL